MTSEPVRDVLARNLHTHVQEIDELTLRQSRPRVGRYLLS